MQGHAEVVRILLEGGADVNQGTTDDGTALMDASLGGHAEVVFLLLAHHALALEPEPADSLPSLVQDLPENTAQAIAALYLCFHAHLQPAVLAVPRLHVAVDVAARVREHLESERPVMLSGLDAVLSGSYRPLCEVVWVYARSTELDMVRLLLGLGAEAADESASAT